MLGLVGAPEPSAPRPFTPPRATERRLSNGLRVIVASRHEVPLVNAQLVFPLGAAHDPLALLGQSYLAMALLNYGPLGRSSDQFAADLDDLAGRFSGGATYDALSAGLSSLSELFPQVLALCNQAVRQPGLAQEDLDRVRARTISELRVAYGSANSLARIVMARVLYGAHPYGQPIAGVPRTLENLTRADVQRLASIRLLPDGATMVLTGDVNAEAGFALAESAYGDWRGSGCREKSALVPVSLPSSRVVVVDLPDSGRSAVWLGRVTIERRHPRYFEGLVAMALLSGYSGRLNVAVRVKRGLSYGASAQLQARREPGPFSATTLVDHRKVGETVEVMREVIASLVTQPPTEAELVPRKAMLRGSFGRSLDSVAGLGSSFAELALNDLPLSEYDEYLARIDAVTPRAVADFARDFLIEGLSVVVVGDAQAIVPSLRGAFAGVEEYRAADIDVLTI